MAESTASDRDPEGGPGTELYAVLHVSRDATAEEVKRSYRQLATVYHPDKYNGTSKQMLEVASENFQRIQKAYEVLSDPHLRDIYDLYGVKGLNSGMEVGERLKTRAEIRDELDRLEALKQERRRSIRVNQMGTTMVGITLAETLRRMEWRPRVTTMQMVQQVQAPLGDKDLLVMGSSMVARRGMGGGTVQLVFKRTLSPRAAVELMVVAGLRTQITVSTSRQLSQNAHASISASFNASDGSLSLNNSWTRQLYPSTSGFIQWGLGSEGGLGIGWQHQLSKGLLTGDVKVGGERGIAASASCSRQFSDKSTGKIGTRLGVL
eukprot:TRINITY_DN9974_c0_g1_i1.p1 TRINITY_DN9974_c0_g1~~TRINITY_DN9974_c0_g1_i1.p1  ORF type:complete len:321 (-),score=58.67 TRINITY_DN9974_c0_g1_i1:94-1056(-)